jgi:hypothetical protein
MSRDEEQRRGEPAGVEAYAWPPQPFACIAGAPRCGTTTLSRMLQSHPQISFSNVKEPHFFSMIDLHGKSDEELRDFVAGHYLERYFPEVNPDAKIIAEGSVSYLYAPEHMQAILRLWPDAKFIISARDPLKLIPSLHQRLLYQGDEIETDLDRAWHLIEERRLGRKVPRSCLDARQLFYDEAARFGKHVGRFFEIVGRERCHVILFDDLQADPEKVHADLIAFLGLDPAPMPEGKPHRAARGFRIGWLQRLLKRPPVARTILAGQHFRKRVADAPQREPSWISRQVMDARLALLRWNRTPAPKPIVSSELAGEIRDTLRDDTLEFSRLIGRDLSHWLGGIGPVVEPAP